MNFSSLFNQWRSQPGSGVFQLIDQPNITMGRLLDEDSFLTQYKSGNLKMVEFMKYQRYQELIQFVTIVGPPEDKKRSYKYPLSACQALSIQNNTAFDLFLPDKPIVLQTKVLEEVQFQTEIQVEQPSPQKPEQNILQTNQQPINEQKDIIKVSQLIQDSKQKSPESQIQTLGVKQQSKEIQIPKAASPKQTKRIMKLQKKTLEKLVKNEVPPLITKLLQYFDGQINYTLAGYVSKILTALLGKKPVEFFKYTLQENIIHKIINHAQSRSVGELVVKILTHESTHSLDLRRNFFKQLLNKLSTSNEIYIISNLSAYVCQIIEKIATNLKSSNKITELNNFFFSLDVITQVIKNVMSQEENISVYNAPVLFTYLTNVPFVIPEQQQIVQEFKKLLQHFIGKSCQKLQVNHKDRPKLGGGRLKIVQILRFIIKENILNSKDIVAQTKNFFPILLNLVKYYDMNNMLHNEVIKILEIALTETQGSPLNTSILSGKILLNFISEETDQDRRIKAGGSVYKYRKGFIVHVINLSIRLRELSKTNQHIKELIETPQFSNIYQTFIEKENFNARKSLAGLVMKKEIKHEIMFQKEDIIAAHLNFLQKCPTSIFEPEPQPEQQINIQHPDLIQELQKQLEQNLLIKTDKQDEKPQPGQCNKCKNQEQKSKQQALEQEVQGQGQYWTTHLQYNIDDLVADL